MCYSSGECLRETLPHNTIAILSYISILGIPYYIKIPEKERRRRKGKRKGNRKGKKKKKGKKKGRGKKRKGKKNSD